MNAFPHPVFRSEPWFELASLAEVEVEQMQQEAPSAVRSFLPLRVTLAEKIEADEAQSADGDERPSVAANARGQAIAAWIQEARSSVGASTSVMVNVLK